MEYKSISIKAIVIGAIIDIVGTNLWSIGLMIYLISTHMIINGPLLQQQLKEVINIANHPFVYFLSLSGGVIFSVLSGYIAASIAKRNEVINGTFSSFLCVAFGIYGLFKIVNSSSIILKILGLLVSPLLGMLGGYLRLKIKESSAQN